MSLPNTLLPTKNLEPGCLKFPVFPIPGQTGSAFLGHPGRPAVTENIGYLTPLRSRGQPFQDFRLSQFCSCIELFKMYRNSPKCTRGLHKSPDDFWTLLIQIRPFQRQSLPPGRQLGARAVCT